MHANCGAQRRWVRPAVRPQIGWPTVAVKFLSANPTGPLRVGHGETAVLFYTHIRTLVEATGHRVSANITLNASVAMMKLRGESWRCAIFQT